MLFTQPHAAVSFRATGLLQLAKLNLNSKNIALELVSEPRNNVEINKRLPYQAEKIAFELENLALELENSALELVSEPRNKIEIKNGFHGELHCLDRFLPIVLRLPPLGNTNF